MKIRIIIIASALLVISTTSFSQGTGATAYATATATIITPISITKTVDLNFGNLAVDSITGGGTAILTTASTTTVTGSVTKPLGFPGTITAASFTVGGTTSSPYTYIITLLGAPVTVTSGANTMTVTDLVTSPSGTGVLTAGAQTILLGATLNVATSQAAGTYISSATGIGVTVNYN